MQHALGLAESVSQHPLEWLLLGVLLSLLLLVPGLNVLHIGVYLTLRRGQTGRNRWGAVPHQPVNGVTKTEAPSLEPQPGSGVKNPLIDPQPEPGR